MKKTLALLLSFCMLICLVACGTNETVSSNISKDVTHTTSTDSQIDQTESSTQPDTSYENSNDESLPGNSEEDVQVNKFQIFEKELTNNNIEFQIVQKSASMVGAKEGYGYTFSDGTSVELYLFDKGTEAYKNAIETNKLTLEGFNMSIDVTFNDDLCIFFNGESSNKTQIEGIFKNLK